MDIIIPAIAGALGNLTSDTVKAGYRKLKDLVLRKFGTDNKMTKAIEELEQEPDSPGRKMLLQEAAAKAGADKDEEIMQAAQALLDAVKAQAGGIGMDIGTFKAAELELSRVSAEKSGTAMKIKEVDITGKAILSDIGNSRPNQ